MSTSKPNTIARDILKGWNVLVVEDEPDNLEVAERILKFYGAKVSTAVNGRAALEMIKTLTPKFIISDLSMPEMDGWALLYELKKERRTLDIPVIALTAHAMSGDRERAIAAGFHNYLTKPLTPATFIRDLLNIITEIPEFSEALGTEAPASTITTESVNFVPPAVSASSTPSTSALDHSANQ